MARFDAYGEDNKAIHDTVYRQSLLETLKTKKGDFTQLTKLQQTQLERAGRFVTTLDLSVCGATIAEMNERVAHLLPLFPNLSSLNLSGTAISTILQLPASLVNIAISNCPNLTTLGDTVFSNCTHLKEINLNGAALTQLTSTLPATLEKIYLDRCSHLTTIGATVFSNCTALKTIDLIDCNALSDESKRIIENRKAIHDTVYRQSLLEKLKTRKGDFTQLTELEQTQLKLAGRFVTTLNLSECDATAKEINARVAHLLALFTNLSSLDLRRTALTQLTLPLPASLERIYLGECKHLTTIGNNAFSNCTHLKKIELRDTAITQFTSPLPPSLEEIYLGGCKHLRTIGDNVFSNCTHLKEIRLAYTALTRLTVSLPASLEVFSLEGCVHIRTLRNNVFSNCSHLKIVNLNNTAISQLTMPLPASLEEIDLGGCKHLTAIGKAAFSNCINLKTLDIQGTSLNNQARAALRRKLPLGITIWE